MVALFISSSVGGPRDLLIFPSAPLPVSLPPPLSLPSVIAKVIHRLPLPAQCVYECVCLHVSWCECMSSCVCQYVRVSFGVILWC